MEKTRLLTAVIETAQNNYAAYIEELDGIVATGSTIDGIKQNLTEAINTFIETCKECGCKVPEAISEDYDIHFKMDISSFLGIYTGIFTKSGLERLTGINQKQLWHYANGKSTPRKTQVKRIEQALHRLGQELIAIQF